jgi:hypothetical protein
VRCVWRSSVSVCVDALVPSVEGARLASRKDGRMTDCECGNPRTDRRPCARCREIDAFRVRSDSAWAKICGVLRFNEWLSSFEIRDMTGHAPDDSSVSAALVQMIKRGEVERRWVPRMGMEYRLKEQKRRAA